MHTHRILLIEDDLGEAILAQRTLTKIDPSIEVIRLKNGEDFLSYYKKDEDRHRISLAIMDLHMPSLDGLQVLRKLHEQKDRPPFPIVLFTSSEDKREVREAYALGTSAFVTKPVTTEGYREALENIVNFWLVTNRLP
jgi:CheY-like chemotaxis protein